MIKDLVTVDGKVKRNASPSFACPTMACELADFAAAVSMFLDWPHDKSAHHSSTTDIFEYLPHI